ncbi:MAG: sensor histidine kinase [Salinigranum sp.]
MDVRDREIRVQQLQVLHRILRHNLRNELSIVRGYADLLVDEVDDPRARGHAETIREAGDRLSALAERVHELRSESARTETIDLADVAETECDRLRAAYPGASISCRTPEEGWIRAVPGIDRVVREAVENGIVHNDRDRPSVTVSVETGDDEYVVARIADDGPGIPADEWRAVERGQETPTSHESGVGLWLVRWLTVRSGGEVDVSERDTRGTVVTVKLPKAPS